MCAMTSRKKISFGRTNRYCVTDKQRFSKPPPESGDGVTLFAIGSFLLWTLDKIV